MSKTNWQDPKTSETRSTHISGLQEAVGKIEESIGISTKFEADIPLTEVFISNDDRYRIFQVQEGKRNWILSPTPIIKKNGTVITTGFEIDYGGGAIILDTNDTVANTYTADATYTIASSSPEYATEEGYPDVLSVPNSAVGGDMKVGIKGQTVQNLVKNGDFSEGTNGWSAYGGALSITNGMMKITGNGSQIGFHAYQNKTDLPQVQENRRYYLRAKAMVDNSVATELRLRLVTTDTGAAFGSKIITSPAYGRWYSLSCIGTVPAGRSGYLSFFVQSLYSDATTANGQSHEIERNSFMCVNMGIDSTNPFYNKTVEQMDSMFAQWTDDLSSTLGSKRVRSLGHELFDMEDLLKIGFKKDANGDYYVDNPNVPFGKVLYENKDRYEGQYTIQINGKYIDTAYPNLPGVLAKVQYTDNTVSSDILLGGYNNFSTVTYTTTPNKTVDFIYFGYGWNNPSYIRDLKIQKGTSISEEPYTEDIAYITAEKGGEIQELRSLPNGVQDEIRMNVDGNGLEYVKRCSDIEVLNGGESWSKYKEFDSTICFQSTLEKIIPGVDNHGWLTYFNYVYGGYDIEKESYSFSISSHRIYININKDKLSTADIAGFQAWLSENPLKVIYQLEQEEITPIPWTGITAKKDGTVIIETVIGEVGFYGTQATTKHPTQLIGSVDRLYKVDRDTGVRTRLDVSKCVITTDKLGFTHPDLADGDLLDWDYVPETSYTQGYKSITVPTNMSATVEGLVENSKVQKENIRQLEYKTNTKISNAISNIPLMSVDENGLFRKSWLIHVNNSDYIEASQIYSFDKSKRLDFIITELYGTIGDINSILDNINGEVI